MTLNYANFYARYNQYVKIVDRVQSKNINANYDSGMFSRVEYNGMIIFIRKDPMGNYRNIEIFTGGNLPYLRGGFVYDFTDHSNHTNTLKPHWFYESE